MRQHTFKEPSAPCVSHLDGYGPWLEAEGYQRSTIALSLRYVRGLLSEPVRCQKKHYAPHVRRYLRYLETRGAGLAAVDIEALKTFEKHGFSASAVVQKTGQRTKTPLSDADFSRLRAFLRRGKGPLDRLLVAYLQQSHLKIGRFLQVSPAYIVNAPEDFPDKISRDWLAEFNYTEHAFKPVFNILCRTHRCAYYRMRVRLLEAAKALNLDVDFHSISKKAFNA